MSEADRVFARITTSGSLPSPDDKQFLHVTSRRRGAVAGQSRIVEVVYRRSGHKPLPAEPTPVATWLDGFQARSTPGLPAAHPSPESSVPAPPVAHVMPGWEPLLAPLQPAVPAAKIPTNSRPRPQVAKPEKQPKSIKRAFADPFAADDVGTNCIRCGYLVSAAREKRGLMTCLQCR